LPGEENRSISEYLIWIFHLFIDLMMHMQILCNYFVETHLLNLALVLLSTFVLVNYTNEILFITIAIKFKKKELSNMHSAPHFHPQ
jgi:hypothetical protein